MHTHSPESNVLLEVTKIWIGGKEWPIRSARRVDGAILLGLEGVETRTEAERLRRTRVEVSRNEVPLAAGEYFVADLVGCDVVDEDAATLGKVVGVSHVGQDLLTIHANDNEMMLPLIPEFVLSVDLASRKITVRIPEDLPVCRREPE